jgi:hypothetical protein
MPTRHREEVLNTVLAEAIVTHGLRASPEAIRHGGSQKPDVLISYTPSSQVVNSEVRRDKPYGTQCYAQNLQNNHPAISC